MVYDFKPTHSKFLILAFYYHIPITPKEQALFVPSYLGVFIDSLAAGVESLVLVMHQGGAIHAAEADYALKSKNLHWINLGSITPAWHRHFFHANILKSKLKQIEHCDAFIVRSPTPLAPFFHKYCYNPKLIFMIVGDYAEGAQNFKIKNLRDWIMIQYLKRNDTLFRKQMEQTDILVNSKGLFTKYETSCKTIQQIKTTTLSQNDFFERKTTCGNDTIQLLYTGRIDLAKGLIELIQATSQLIQNGFSIQCNFVGWEADEGKPIEQLLKLKAKELNISQYVIFHGRKTVGDELNQMYRIADIYVIPSYHEGFPRTIWEAMANSLPVIATNVGSIPDYLQDKENAVLIESKRVDELVHAIQACIQDSILRERIIQNGFLLAKENTLEFQTAVLIDKVNHIFNA